MKHALAACKVALVIRALFCGSILNAASNPKPQVEALIYSTMPSTREHRPEMAFDGNDNTWFESKGGMDDGDDFIVLLNRSISLNSVRVITGEPDLTDALNHAVVEGSEDGVHYSKLAVFDEKGTADAKFRRREITSLRIRTDANTGVTKLIIREIQLGTPTPITHAQYGPGRGFIDLSQAPDLTKWAATAEAKMESYWADTAALLYSDGLITPNMVNVVYKTGPGVTGVAATGGGVMTVNAKWCREHPGDTGLTVHETAHVIQCINTAAPGWLIEGTADYIRWVKFEPEHFHPRINVTRATYHDAYQTSATFLGWCTLHYDSLLVTKLNDAARAGTYSNRLFVKFCGKDVDELWAEFIAAYKADPAHILSKPTAPGMEARTLPIVQPGTSRSVDLSSIYSLEGIAADNARFPANRGFDGEGNMLSANLLGTTKTVSGVDFQIGAKGTPNVVPSRGNQIAVNGSASSLWLLASSVEGSHRNQTVTVTYEDGTTKSFIQNFSDWYVPESFPGETRAVRMRYRNSPDGTADRRTFFVYAYGFELDATKSLKRITLPNDEGIRVLAISVAK